MVNSGSSISPLRQRMIDDMTLASTRRQDTGCLRILKSGEVDGSRGPSRYSQRDKELLE